MRRHERNGTVFVRPAPRPWPTGQSASREVKQAFVASSARQRSAHHEPRPRILGIGSTRLPTSQRRSVDEVEASVGASRVGRERARESGSVWGPDEGAVP